jgi:hypothetical protein
MTNGEPIPPHFQFQTAAQTAKAESIQIESIHYMLDVRGIFGHVAEQLFPILLGLNNKGGMDEEECLSTLKNPLCDCIRMQLLRKGSGFALNATVDLVI